MKTLRLVLCGMSVLVLTNGIAAAAGPDGEWVGTAPDGLVFSESSGLCSGDVTLHLTAAGASLSGDFAVTAQRRVAGCVVPPDAGRELSTGQIVASSVDGTVGTGTLSLLTVIASYLHGVPIDFSAIAVSGTFSANQLAATGVLVPMRAWNDFNHNDVPDCNLFNPAANGECGAWAQLSTQPVTLTATRREAPAILSLSATPDVLWPPNHKMVSVSVATTTTGSPIPACSITGVTSTEGGTRPGDIEWTLTGPLTVDLLAQRAGAGPGRVYTLAVTCTNAAGSAARTTSVMVPHDQR